MTTGDPFWDCVIGFAVCVHIAGFIALLLEDDTEATKDRMKVDGERVWL